eukprot:XP_017951887.1 PREDICTED: uncharacterized protein LOC105948081 [Xenopus tropicalis]
MVVKQPELLTAEVGGSVTINCTFDKSDAVSVTWSVCEEGIDLKKHSCYKHRVRFEDKYHREITITNLTENDSAKYCCIVESNNKKTSGNGTMVKVTAKTCPKETEIQRKWLIIIIAFEASVIVLLLALLITARVQNGSLADVPTNVIEEYVGGSVSIRCKHKGDGSSYSVSWGIDCDTEKKNTLIGHACYKNRLKFSALNEEITINNLTENDAGLYCCYVEIAGQNTQPADKTRLHVKERKPRGGHCDCEVKTLPLLMDILRIIFLVILIILVSILIKKS